MKVLFVVPRFHTNLAVAVRALLEDGVEVAVVTGRPDVPEGEGMPEPVVFHDGATLSAARALLRARRPDAVIIRKTPGVSQPFALAATLAGIRTLGYDQRPANAPRGRLAVLSGALRGRPIRRMTPNAGLPGAGPPDPFATWLPFPVDIRAGPPPPREGPARILMVGKLAEARKRHFLLIEAAERLARAHDVRLTIVGSGRLDIGAPDTAHAERIRAYARTGALGDRFTLVEDVPFTGMAALYRAHDICALPSTREPFGISPLEAMGQGAAAVVSTDNGATGTIARGIAAGHPCGAVFADGDGAALEAALLPLVADRAALETARRAAWEWAREILSPARFARNFRAFVAEAGRKA